jgi:hypothetical protein
MSFSEELRADADGIWRAHDHPVVRGIGDVVAS